MRLIRLFWWLARHRFARRALVWLILRLIRRAGWRRAAKLLLGGRRRWRFLALCAWRVAVQMLRVGRAALRLIGARPRTTRQLGPRSRTVRRLARRRDAIRRALLSAAGVDPDWRPPSRRQIGTTRR